LEVGEEVEVYVLDVDRERERIALSRKRLLPDPWEKVTATLGRNDVVEGRVTHVTDFGAFVDLGEGVEGLVHVSEMPDGEQTLSALVPSTNVKVRILHIDPLQQRISLRLEETGELESDVEAEAAAEAAAEAETEAETEAKAEVEVETEAESGAAESEEPPEEEAES
jgi:small subunit ribosomal protein S1